MLRTEHPKIAGRRMRYLASNKNVVFNNAAYRTTLYLARALRAHMCFDGAENSCIRRKKNEREEVVPEANEMIF